MNKQVKQVVKTCRRIVKQVRKDDYFSATVRANFVIELEKFDSKRGYYLIVVRDRRVPKTGSQWLTNKDRLRVDWLNVNTPFFDSDLWEMANDILVDMQVYEAEASHATAAQKVS